VDRKEDVLAWWKKHAAQYETMKILAPLARMMLAIPASSASVERAFSNVSYACDGRNGLSAVRAEQYSVIREYLRSDDFDEEVLHSLKADLAAMKIHEEDEQ
jgi:hypothetical protein